MLFLIHFWNKQLFRFRFFNSVIVTSEFILISFSEENFVEKKILSHDLARSKNGVKMSLKLPTDCLENKFNPSKV